MECEQCQALLNNKAIIDRHHYHLNKDYREIEEGSKRGCSLCHLQWCLFSMWAHPYQHHKDGVRDTHCYVAIGLDGFGYTWLFGYSNPDPYSSGRHSYNVQLEPLSSIKEQLVANNRWGVARKWIDDCQQSHMRCRTRFSRTSFRPSRLVEIARDHNGIMRLKVTLGNSVEPGTRYCTLSHCWGKSVYLTLTSHNLDALKSAIPQDQLSPTFRDAISITEELGLHYIWIDSLCIKQDSADDWRTESVLMADIYENSWCNIAATRAADGSQGCLPSNLPQTRFPSIKLPSLYDQAMKYPKYYLKDVEALSPEVLKSTDFTWASTLWKGNVEYAPLMKRAWVFQEVTLATRSLHCGEHELFWECEELRASESLPDGILEGTRGRVIERMAKRLDARNVDDPHPRWHDLVEKYTGLGLTYPLKDQLVAISGLAKRLSSSLTAESYYAGLWKENLEHDLMWLVPSSLAYSWTGRREWNDECLPHPSWSWASVNKPIRFADPGFGYQANHQVAHILGQVLHITRTTGDDPFVDTSEQVITLVGTIGTALFRTALDYTHRHNREDRIEYGDHVRHGRVRLDRDILETKTTVMCLPMLIRSSPSPDDLREGQASDQYRIDGLLVETTGRNVGEYRRIGFFGTRPAFEEVLTIFKLSNGQRDDSIECQEYLGLSDQGYARYKITLV